MSVFSGPERIELLPSAGRPVRQGGELNVSDFERVEEALAAEDAPRAREYLNYLHPGWGAVLGILSEWIGHWHDCLRERGLAQVADRALALCRATPGWVEPGPPRLDSLFADLTAALEAGPWDRPRQCWADYRRELELRHDLLCWQLWALPSSVGDEALALEINSESLQRSPGYDMLWAMASALSPEELALTAAEHLRGHMSSASIVDEPDRIRVVLDACGSGGAMRRGAPGATPGYALAQEPSAMTWGRKGQVPLYCTHCALNEIQSVKRLGRLAWVTEFDPDPARPCGWTFFKSGDAPDEYHRRLGNQGRPSTA